MWLQNETLSKTETCSVHVSYYKSVTKWFIKISTTTILVLSHKIWTQWDKKYIWFLGKYEIFLKNFTLKQSYTVKIHEWMDGFNTSSEVKWEYKLEHSDKYGWS